MDDEQSKSGSGRNHDLKMYTKWKLVSISGRHWKTSFMPVYDGHAPDKVALKCVIRFMLPQQTMFSDWNGSFKSCSRVFLLTGVMLIVFSFVRCSTQTASKTQTAQQEEFSFPTSNTDGANVAFTSVPDLFNWNIAYPQSGWEEAMDWFLGGMKKEGPAFMLNAGDIMDARWWNNAEQIREQTRKYWGGFKKRFNDKNIDIYIAPGDHEYGDDQGLQMPELTPVFAKQFSKIFDMPGNGPENHKGRAYFFEKQNLAVISLDTFEQTGDRLSMTVGKKQLSWLNRTLQSFGDKDFVIVQGHVPVLGPVRSKNSSANMLEKGADSKLWGTLVKHDVDLYLCGEHHRITVLKQDGIWQIVHGALWGTQNDVNYLRGLVYDDRLRIELFRFPVRYEGWFIGHHPHRGKKNRPREKVIIPEKVRKNGPNRIGVLEIQTSKDGNTTTTATGVFSGKNEER